MFRTLSLPLRCAEAHAARRVARWGAFVPTPAAAAERGTPAEYGDDGWMVDAHARAACVGWALYYPF